MKVEVWSKDNCPYCDMAKKWLTSHGIEFTENKIGYNGVTREMLLERVPTARTVPQIIIDEQVVGGWDDLRKTEFYLTRNGQ
jgi:glutaredoxin